VTQSNELARKLEAARSHMQVEWSAERAAAAEGGMVRKKRRRAAVRAGAAAALVLAVAAAGLALWPRQQQAAVPAPVIAARPEVEVQPVDAAAKFSRDEVQAGRVRVRVAKASKPRRFRAGIVEVEAFDARFLMERADAVWVRVEEGEAIVRWPGGEARLTAGSEGWYPPAPVEAAGPEPVVDTQPVAKHRPSPRPAAWRRLAEAGDYTAAYDELQKSSAPVRDEPAELLLSADVSRLSHHPAQAIAPLQQVLKRHASDPRAPLAAFTLGRVLLDELGRPSEAADAFARARALAPEGPLSDDALAREVEARSRGGDTARARTLAEEYLRRLPNGPRARWVRHHGGLE
jgi:transmembrane sensor